MAVKLKYLSTKFPVITVTGPRQSGKTTLVKKVFPKHDYVSLEDYDNRDFAAQDPRGFLKTYGTGVIIDEIQRVPRLFSYIQTVVDTKNKPGMFILTGSQNFLLTENVSQTLAGRVAILKLLPLSINELSDAKYTLANPEKYVFKGFYPRIYDKNISPRDWYPNYIHTYLERDIRLIKNISNLSTFQNFIRLCAGRTGQILNLSSLGNDCGITHNTAKDWLSILESSYLVFLLKPYHNNFNKRLVKMPKLYFYDTGLACSLLGIQTVKQLETHYFRGSLFESFVISEIMKNRLNLGLEPNCYYWRDKVGNEIDCIIEHPQSLVQVEIKAGKTIASDFLKGLKYWQKIAGDKNTNPYLIYSGEKAITRESVKILSWKEVKLLTHPLS
ncbi:MAG: ATP-binding protein [Elusimicrobiota bacterium]